MIKLRGRWWFQFLSLWMKFLRVTIQMKATKIIVLSEHGPVEDYVRNHFLTLWMKFQSVAI